MQHGVPSFISAQCYREVIKCFNFLICLDMSNLRVNFVSHPSLFIRDNYILWRWRGEEGGGNLLMAIP